MIRRHPLTTLLLIATLVVDVTLMVVGGGRDVRLRTALAGLLLGQTGALALWAVWGSGHRLGRVSVLVVATCAIALATGGKAMLGTQQWLAILASYTLAVYLWSLMVAAGNAYTGRIKSQEDDGPSWQVSLIELFGWTILVAIVSFASRSMSFTFLRSDTYVPLKAALLLATPAMLAAGVRSSLDDFTPSKLYWFCFAGAAVSVVVVFNLVENIVGVPLILAQVGYLVIWFVVVVLDRSMRDTKTDDEVSLDAQPQTEPELSEIDH